jgi:SAM-dependent methyltransferase
MKTTKEIAAILLLIAAIAGVRMISGVSLADIGIPRLFADDDTERPPVRFEPSSPAVVDEMVRMAAVTQKDMVYDLGCGDGRIVIAAARKAGARGVGVDTDPDLIVECRKNAEANGVSHLVEFRRGDLYETDISGATVVMLYLSPDANLALRPRLLRELRPGARIVSHSHDMGDWKPDSESEKENHPLYFWVVPAPVSGRWRFEIMDKYAGGEYFLEFEQKYQEVRAKLSSGSRTLPVTGTVLTGKTVRFLVGGALGSLVPPVECSGEVEGDRIAGKCRSQKQSGGWNARRVSG